MGFLKLKIKKSDLNFREDEGRIDWLEFLQQKIVYQKVVCKRIESLKPSYGINGAIRVISSGINSNSQQKSFQIESWVYFRVQK